MSKEMREQLDTFRQKMLNEGLFNDEFLIIYQITNYKGIADLDDTNKFRGFEKTSERKSPIYSYIQKGKTSDDARNSFENKWGELANYEPKPKLEILSVQELGSISDKIKTY